MDPTFYPCNQPALNEKQTLERFKEKVVVVAGGASGIGFAAAHRFANDGASVAILDFNEELGQSSASHMESEGLTGKAKFYYADIRHKQSCDDAIKAVAADNNGKIDHLVNAAAFFGSQGITAVSSDWRNSFEVNVAGYSNMVQGCLPYFSKGSSVVNLSSISAKRAQPCRWTYSATKGAIDSLTRCMALDLSKKGIRVNSVSPGWIWSPEQAKSCRDGGRMSMRPAIASFDMLERDGETSEVASVIAFLCSRDASFVTGADIAVDGGYCAMGPEQHGHNSAFAGTSAKAE